MNYLEATNFALRKWHSRQIFHITFSFYYFCSLCYLNTLQGLERLSQIFLYRYFEYETEKLYQRIAKVQ